MRQNFVIKKGKSQNHLITWGLLFIIISTQTKAYIALSPIIFILSLAILLDLIMNLRWIFSCAVALDTDKREIILNHSLFFYKKRILIGHIKDVDIAKGNVILFNSTPLSKWQKIVCKKSDCYIVNFDTINICERRELMQILLSWVLTFNELNEENEEETEQPI